MLRPAVWRRAAALPSSWSSNAAGSARQPRQPRRRLESTEAAAAEAAAAPAAAHPLDQFYETEENREQLSTPGRVGRAWRMDELRGKSLEDLRGLWWVLVKERNLLMTEKHMAMQLGARMSGTGRIKKVKLGMNRLKVVLAERKGAYEWAMKRRRTHEQLHAERGALRDRIALLLHERGAMSVADVMAPVHADEHLLRVANSYGGVGAFCRKQGWFRVSTVQALADSVQLGAASPAAQMVRLRPGAAAAIAEELAKEVGVGGGGVSPGEKLGN